MNKAPEVNALVVMNNTPDATVYRVKEIDGRAVGVIDATIEEAHPNQRIQWIDVTVVMAPSVGQLADFNG